VVKTRWEQAHGVTDIGKGGGSLAPEHRRPTDAEPNGPAESPVSLTAGAHVRRWNASKIKVCGWEREGSGGRVGGEFDVQVGGYIKIIQRYVEFLDFYTVEGRIIAAVFFAGPIRSWNGYK
jgi:hypothetical protein